MLAKAHPVQLVLGSLLIQAELASKNCQLTLGVLNADSIEWTTVSRDVFEEIAADAQVMGSRIEIYASDGIFDRAERAQLLKDAREIEIEAREGRII